MKRIAKILVAIAINAVVLYLAAKFIDGFHVSANPLDVLIVAFVLAILNLLAKPILKLILSPVIILTLGLGLIIVNAVILYILDFLMGQLTIDSIVALLIAAVFVSVGNFVYHLATKS